MYIYSHTHTKGFYESISLLDKSFLLLLDISILGKVSVCSSVMIKFSYGLFV